MLPTCPFRIQTPFRMTPLWRCALHWRALKPTAGRRPSYAGGSRHAYASTACATWETRRLPLISCSRRCSS